MTKIETLKKGLDFALSQSEGLINKYKSEFDGTLSELTDVMVLNETLRAASYGLGEGVLGAAGEFIGKITDLFLPARLVGAIAINHGYDIEDDSVKIRALAVCVFDSYKNVIKQSHSIQSEEELCNHIKELHGNDEDAWSKVSTAASITLAKAMVPDQKSNVIVSIGNLFFRGLSKVPVVGAIPQSVFKGSDIRKAGKLAIKIFT